MSVRQQQEASHSSEHEGALRRDFSTDAVGWFGQQVVLLHRHKQEALTCPELPQMSPEAALRLKTAAAG